MDKQQLNQQMIDRYVRKRMGEAQEAEFETLLLESPQLQDQLEVALAMRETLRTDNFQTGHKEYVATPASRWPILAMAASLAVATVSLVLFMNARQEIGDLQNQVRNLNQPVTSVLTVPVYIMRSAGNAVPDVIVQKPEGNAALLLEIELSSAMQTQESLLFTLTNSDNIQLYSWTAQPGGSDQSVVLLKNNQIPVGQVWLDISIPGSDRSERRLLEFR